MQVDPNTVASDSFMVNMQSVLLRFAEPFMDANYTKACFLSAIVICRSHMMFSDGSYRSSVLCAIHPN